MAKSAKTSKEGGSRSDQGDGVDPHFDKKLKASIEFARIEGFTRRWNMTIRWAGICVLAFCAWKSVQALAGKETLAKIFVQVFANATFSQVVTSTLGGSGVVYGLYQRRIARKVVKRYGSRLANLESAIDPERTSSNLDPSGTTRLEDRHE